jgi:hypothetical protein
MQGIEVEFRSSHLFTLRVKFLTPKLLKEKKMKFFFQLESNKFNMAYANRIDDPS